jgi:L-rhamnose isomerase
MDRVKLGLDFFDASINRISAWTVGLRNAEKALLYALLLPNQQMKELQDREDFSKLMMIHSSNPIRLVPSGITTVNPKVFRSGKHGTQK